MSSHQKNQANNALLLKYAGLTIQIMVGLAIAVFAGFKVDKWFTFSAPIFVWVLPLLVIIVLIYKVIKDTSKK